MSGYPLESRESGGLRRRFFLAFGLALFVAGGALLGYGLYGYFNEESIAGTGASVGRSASNLLPAPPEQIADVEGLPVAIPYNNPSLTGDTSADGSASSGAIPLGIKMMSIDVDARVVEMGMNSAGIPHVPLNGDDVAWYNFSSRPGEGSNAVFAGHINWEGRQGVFGKLGELQSGDKVRLATKGGGALVYEVVANFPVDPDDPASLKVMAPTDNDIITLITCGGTWIPDPSEQFGGSYTDRTIVQARLLQSNVEGDGVPAEISSG